MELQFETLDYQTHAIQAAVDLFIGQPNQQTEFGLKAQNDMRFVANLPLQINDEQLQQNLGKQQNTYRRNGNRHGENLCLLAHDF